MLDPQYKEVHDMTRLALICLAIIAAVLLIYSFTGCSPFMESCR